MDKMDVNDNMLQEKMLIYLSFQRRVAQFGNEGGNELRSEPVCVKLLVKSPKY